MFDDQERIDMESMSELNKYYVDIAICLDVTGANLPGKLEIEQNIERIYTMIKERAKVRLSELAELRIKVIPFRDFKYDGPEAITDSGFFVIPEEVDRLKTILASIQVRGGGDEPESALEALALAMQSDWTVKGNINRRRHVILMFTDASAVSLDDFERTLSPYYPENMPKSLEELWDRWEGGDQEFGMPEARAARLVVFAPNVYPWDQMQVWNRVWTNYIRAGFGMQDIDLYEKVSDLIFVLI